jgi:hypothetical protein
MREALDLGRGQVERPHFHIRARHAGRWRRGRCLPLRQLVCCAREHARLLQQRIGLGPIVPAGDALNVLDGAKCSARNGRAALLRMS